jgi:hypothetical protein
MYGCQATTGKKFETQTISAQTREHNKIAIMERLLLKTSLSLTENQAAGIVGNMMTESTCNPSSYIATDAGQGQSGGLCQWHDGVNGHGRFTNLCNFASKRGKEWSDLETQVDYLEKELLSTEKNALNKLKETNTLEDAATAFCKYFERPKVCKGRIENAKDVLATFRKSKTS